MRFLAVFFQALVGALPGDRGPGSSTDLTPEGDALAVVTGHVAERHEELWGDWRARGKGQIMSVMIGKMDEFYFISISLGDAKGCIKNTLRRIR